MSYKVDLRKPPFSLGESAIQWVEKTIENMTIEEKIGQLFVTVGWSVDEDILKTMLSKGMGGIMYRPKSKEEIRKVHKFLQDNSKIPLFLAADLEQGGNGCVTDGTSMGRQMLIAATNKTENAYRLGYVSAKEGTAVGVNWAFAPVIDIDQNWRNPIMNVRTYGDDADRVLAMGSECMRGMRDAGVPVSIKHFPGDGCDERDQHLHATVNTLSADEWMASYGKIYKGLIEQGAETVMVGHICQPALVEKVNPNATFEEKYRPGTLSPELLNGILRDELGFNGLIATDATTMLGFSQDLPREIAVPTSIAAGCDVFLFNREFLEDYEFMMEGYKNGILTDERLNDALTSILGLKAHLGLHEKQKNNTLIPPETALDIIGCEQHKLWAKEIADQGITLVKDTRSYLPLTPKKYKKVALYIVSDSGNYGSQDDLLQSIMTKRLEEQGFDVYGAPEGELFDRDHPMCVKAFAGKYDLVIYVFNLLTSSNNTVVRINWRGFMGSGNNPWFSAEIPVVAVSFANPYHLIDIPRIHTYINAYTCSEFTIDAVMDKLLGESEFTGINPVDPFCGREDTKL